jgi:hypothetical protein
VNSAQSAGLAPEGRRGEPWAAPRTHPYRKNSPGEPSAAQTAHPLEIGTSPVDYHDPDNWLALPSGDAEGQAARAFDVFYLCPTTCYRDDLAICDVSDAAMRKRAGGKLEQQASIFAAGNLYSPFYRQLSMYRFPELGSIPAIMDEVADHGGVDARAAFDSYLQASDQRRPLVFAAHSQGTIALLALLPWLRTQHPEVLDRTIAAYLIGFTVTPADLKRIGLPFATGASDTGVVISYNTEKTGTTGFNPLIVSDDALVINPVNWRTDETPATSEQSLGSRLIDEQGELRDYPHFASARIDLMRRSLTTDAPILPRAPWPAGVLHSQDMGLFYYDLKANVDLRVAAWFENHPNRFEVVKSQGVTD